MKYTVLVLFQDPMFAHLYSATYNVTAKRSEGARRTAERRWAAEFKTSMYEIVQVTTMAGAPPPQRKQP